MIESINPTRKIRSSKSSLRGKVFSTKTNSAHDFESSLERDFLELIEFDPNVSFYVEQPVTIFYEDNGSTKSYTPDFLLKYRSGIMPASSYSPLLVEIKYADDLKKNRNILKAKFDAAEKYASEKDWRFKVLTEKEIRNDYLKNAKFLGYYAKFDDVPIEDFTLLLTKMKALRVSTPQELIIAAARTESRQAELLFTLWHMVANNYIACDLTNSITMKSEIWEQLPI